MILSAPCTQSITALLWNIPLTVVPGDRKDDEEEQFLRGCVPHLERLSYGDNPLLDRLLRMRRIRNLECRTWDATFHEALCSSLPRPGLSFLLTSERARFGHSLSTGSGNPSVLNELARHVTDNAAPYRNLRHIGLFVFGDASVSDICSL